MPLHDAFLRITPYELLLPDPGYPARYFPAVRDELGERGVEGDPGAFALLDATREAIRDLRDPEDDREQAHSHALLLFHAFHLWDAAETGEGDEPVPPHLLVSAPAARWAVETGPASGDAAPLEPGALYVQLPQHLFWVRESAAQTPRSLDGYFHTQVGETLHLLGVTGVMGPGRGFQVLPLPGVPAADAPVWMRESMREEGEDFRSEIPGAELEVLYEVRSAGELLKLAARLADCARRFPRGLVPVRDPGAAGRGGGEGAEGEGRDPGHGRSGPAPSALAYRTLTLG